MVEPKNPMVQLARDRLNGNFQNLIIMKDAIQIWHSENLLDETKNGITLKGMMINLCFLKRAKLEDRLEEKEHAFFISVEQALFDQLEWVRMSGKLINLSQNDQFTFYNIPKSKTLYFYNLEWKLNAKKSK